MLKCLPAGVGPTPLKFGDFGDGTALLVTPLFGRIPAAKLPPVPGVLEFVKSLEVSAPLALGSHPYPRAIRERAGGWLDTILEDLAGKSWPVSLQHGDFAPGTCVAAKAEKASPHSIGNTGSQTVFPISTWPISSYRLPRSFILGRR